MCMCVCDESIGLYSTVFARAHKLTADQKYTLTSVYVPGGHALAVAELEPGGQ